MKSTTSKLSSIKDTSKSPATPIVTPSVSQGHSSTVAAKTVKSHQSNFKKADSITDVLNSATACCQVSQLKSPLQEEAFRRNTPISPMSKSKKSHLTPLSFNSESLLVSSTLASSSSRKSAPSPRASPREQNNFSLKFPATSRHHEVSKNCPADCYIDPKSVNTGDNHAMNRKSETDYNHRLSSLPFRDIFSPIPFEHVGDEGLQQYGKAATWRKDVGDNGVRRSTDESFPSIKVEECGESGFEETTWSIETFDFGHIKKSPTVPGNSFSGVYNPNKQDAVRQNTVSLNVPPPFIKWRTAEGRLIAAMNDDLLTGALSRLYCRSEGSIPIALQDANEHINIVDNKVNQAENNISLSRQFSRHVPLHVLRNTAGSSTGVKLVNTGDKECILLTPNQHTEQASQSKLSFPLGSLGSDMKKNTQFMSPQPHRRRGPRY
ncbi:hypothetical protein BsWGS_25522 [Bradybaena similaris]